MTRTLVCIVIALAVCSPAFADDSATPAQLDAAKQAYADGKALHDKGNFTEAVEKFKESYRLSKNPMLLYNIALTMEEAGGKDLALLYYRQFLTDAPANADQRPTAVERVKALEKELTKLPEPVKPPSRNAIKPEGTYSATDFEHQVVEEAPPNQPLDLTASVPSDSGFKVTMFYRAAGEGEFTAQPMKWRYKELIGRIPAARMTGTTVQYYIEVRDSAGNLVTRAGKSITPNLISIDANAKPKFYPDLTDDTAANAQPDTSSNAEDEDPLHPHKQKPKSVEPAIVAPVTFDRHEGLTDVGSSKFGTVKWTATVGAVAFLGAAVVFAVRAHNEAKSLQEDASSCGTPPCRPFDTQYDADLESTGRRDETIFGVTLGIGIAAAAVASYYWYREQDQATPQSMTALHVAPTIDNRSIGAMATARF
jgi:tetratricopeptide (TPR) repeat protein